jgi:nucleoside-diphosphate-sugar epimerase
MAILITGGMGFIGKHLIRLLLNDIKTEKIICVDNLGSGNLDSTSDFINNERFKFLKMDICNTEDIQKIKDEVLKTHSKINQIYHLACPASPDYYKKYPFETIDTCYQGTKNILELAHFYSSTILYTSTSEVYGDPLINPQKEDYYGNVNTVGSRSCYDEGKRIGETLCYLYKIEKNVDARIVRIFNTYGEGMLLDDGRVITNIIKSLLTSTKFKIYGDGNQTRSFCHVSDLIRGLYIFMNKKMENGYFYPYSNNNEKLSLPIFNLGNPNEKSINEIVLIIQELLNRKIDVEYIGHSENDPQKRRPDISQAMKYLNWQPEVNFVDGFMKMWDFYNKSH